VLTKLENDKSSHQVDGVITRRRTDQPDLLSAAINNYHLNIKFTIEQNLSKFLDTNLIANVDNKIATSV